MGTYQSSSSLARVIGPFVSGPVYAAFGPSAPYLLGALVALPAVWFVWRVRAQSSISVSKIDTA
jgi:predicted MFS family arabinose efflux permease